MTTQGPCIYLIFNTVSRCYSARYTYILYVRVVLTAHARTPESGRQFYCRRCAAEDSWTCDIIVVPACVYVNNDIIIKTSSRVIVIMYDVGTFALGSSDDVSFARPRTPLALNTGCRYTIMYGERVATESPPRSATIGGCKRVFCALGF